MPVPVGDPAVPYGFPEGVFRLIGTDLRTLEPCRDKMPQDHFQGLPVPFVHREKEERQHHKDHDHGRKCHVPGFPEKKKERQSHKDRCSETEDLTSGEVQKQLALYSRQVSGHIGVEIIQCQAPFRRSLLKRQVRLIVF